MTAVTSISAMKGKKQGAASRNSDGKPKPGTLLRQKYDELRAGGVVAIGNAGYKNQLSDFYGMELAVVTEGRKKIGCRLLGEWEGPYYVPIERIVAGMAGEQ